MFYSLQHTDNYFYKPPSLLFFQHSTAIYQETAHPVPLTIKPLTPPAMDTKPKPPLTSSPYPYASAPDIIRAYQKDAYFTGVLTNRLTDLHRRLLGVRSSHAWTSEARTLADLIYLSLTTLVGNRTLGEEYCDLVQVHEPLDHNNNINNNSKTTRGGPEIPSIHRRASLIATSVLAPYIASLLLPRLRKRLRTSLQSRLSALTKSGHGAHGKNRGSRAYRIQRYILAHLPDLTSTSHIQAITLAIFYFTGAYYSLSKRLLGLRYVFTTARRQSQPGEGDRVGYEVLGVLLVVQMAVRAWLHLRATMSVTGTEAEMETEAEIRERAGVYQDVSLDVNSYTSNNELLGDPGRLPNSGGGQRSLEDIGATTHTPVVRGGRARYDLGDEKKSEKQVMGWIKGRQQRNCTLCLEGLKDPAATQCGHVFCWTCIGDWVREKPECPLCRREALVQHILPLRTG